MCVKISESEDNCFLQHRQISRLNLGDIGLANYAISGRLPNLRIRMHPAQDQIHPEPGNQDKEEGQQAETVENTRVLKQFELP